GHDRGRSSRDGASGALEGGVADDSLVIDLQVEPQLVAAQRVVAVGAAVRIGDLPKIARLLGVIDDQLLVEIPQVRHQPNSSFTLAMAPTNWSISSRVL